MITLSEYIEHLITYLNLPNTDKTKKNIKKQFERTLKDDLKIWYNAPTTKVAKTKAKIFKISELEKAYYLNQKYLAKQLDIDEQKYEELASYNNWLKEQTNIVSKKEFEKNIEVLAESTKQYNEQYKISLEEQNNVMLKALFEHFFTPLNIKQWEKDKITIDKYESIDELTVISARLRLEQPDGKGYYKEKKRP